MLLNQPQNQYRHARSINLQNLTHTTNGRPGVNRALTADPVHVIEALARQCPIGAAALGRVFETHEAILHACCDAWNWLIDQPHQVSSIGQCGWGQDSQ
jgi:hypothetical protein